MRTSTQLYNSSVLKSNIRAKTFRLKFANVSYIGSTIVLNSQQSVGGIAVSIAAFQAVDPGSTQGYRKVIFDGSGIGEV